MDTIALSFWIYTLAIVALELYSARFAKNSYADFLLADRGLGAWVGALSSSASAESGWVTLGLVGMAYKTGAAVLNRPQHLIERLRPEFTTQKIAGLAPPLAIILKIARRTAHRFVSSKSRIAKPSGYMARQVWIWRTLTRR